MSKQNRLLVNSTTPTGEIKRYEGPLMLNKTDAKILDGLKGDEKAEVQISHDVSSKNYGNGCSTFVSIKLVCNQDDVSMGQAVMLGGKLIRTVLFNEHQEMIKEYQARAGVTI